MTTFNLPDLGEGLAEAEIVRWHIKVGDQIKVDQPIIANTGPMAARGDSLRLRFGHQISHIKN